LSALRISGRDLILLFGGLFLLYKASHEIFMEVEAHPTKEAAAGVDAVNTGATLFGGTIVQIGIVDIVFSLDSVITAVGMVDNIGVMVAAVFASVAVMMFAAKPIGEFVDRHPSIKVLALAFLTMVGWARCSSPKRLTCMCPKPMCTPPCCSRWGWRRSTSGREASGWRPEIA
jgi:predicted tellurium resistance membrane protein TerC